MKKKTLVLGASDNPGRYSYLAIKKLTQHGHPVVAIGRKKTQVGITAVETTMIPFTDVHTVTLYLNPTNQQPYYNYILDLNPKRIIFNPGTENEALVAMAEERGIEALYNCTLVMLSTHQF